MVVLFGQVDELARKPDSIVISIYMNLNLDYLLQKMWEYMGLIRIYTKRRAQPPDLTAPIVLSSERHGLTVEAAAGSISKVMHSVIVPRITLILIVSLVLIRLNFSALMFMILNSINGISLIIFVQL